MANRNCLHTTHHANILCTDYNIPTVIILITAILRGCRSTKTCDLSFVRGMRGTIFSDCVFQLVKVLFPNILVLFVKQFVLTIIVNIYFLAFGIYWQITWII